MRLSLRDEILVVADYENIRLGSNLLAEVNKWHTARGLRKVGAFAFRSMLRQMVYDENDSTLEPWRHISRSNRLVLVGFIAADDDPLRFYYKLTPKGWRWQQRILNVLVSERGMRPDEDTGET